MNKGKGDSGIKEKGKANKRKGENRSPLLYTLFKIAFQSEFITVSS